MSVNVGSPSTPGSADSTENDAQKGACRERRRNALTWPRTLAQTTGRPKTGGVPPNSSVIWTCQVKARLSYFAKTPSRSRAGARNCPSFRRSPVGMPSATLLRRRPQRHPPRRSSPKAVISGHQARGGRHARGSPSSRRRAGDAGASRTAFRRRSVGTRDAA